MIHWNVAILNEVDVLCRTYTGENKTATDKTYKTLLTQMPIFTSIMDTYGLIYFIDETTLPYPEIIVTRPTAAGTYYSAKETEHVAKGIETTRAGPVF